LLLVAAAALRMLPLGPSSGFRAGSKSTSADPAAPEVRTGVHQPGSATAPSSTLSERLSRAQSRWEALAAGVRALDAADQAGLDRLYGQAREAIGADEEAWLQMLSRSIGGIIGSSFEESFFAVSSWIRASESPARILDTIWRYQPPADPAQADAHHPAMTQAVRYERVEAFGVRELRQQIAQGTAKLSAAESRRLVQELLPRAARERSLNLSMEMYPLLAALHAPEPSMQASLQGHSQRDREMIQGLLDAQ
jgi:hypothetical protein